MRWKWVLALGFVVVATLAWRVDRAGRLDDAAPADVVVVLGARVEPDGTASPTLRARVEHAARLFRRGLAPRLLFSGGVGDFGDAEAVVARTLAVQLGVPLEACVVETQSHSTLENARLSATLLHPRGWTRVVVVTDPYHLPRARRLFSQEGLTVTGSPVLDAPRHQAWSSRLYWTLREVAALIRDRVTTSTR